MANGIIVLFEGASGCDLNCVESCDDIPCNSGCDCVDCVDAD